MRLKWRASTVINTLSYARRKKASKLRKHHPLEKMHNRQNNTEMSQLVAGPKQTTHAAHTDSTDVLSTSVWTLKAKS